MTFDFSSVKPAVYDELPISPIDIFYSATVNDTNINDLWLGQGDALREWHTNRVFKDIAVILNTGAGKTLVGLLIAQSLVNETRRPVVYACSSIQLVEQTAAKAAGYGLPVTTYYRGKFSQDGLYQRAAAPCITTYQALFNGRSRFISDDLAAVIFDDAHTVENILRDQFSLRIDRDELPTTYNDISGLFQSYYNTIGLASTYEEMLSKNYYSHLFVPPFEVKRNITAIRKVMLDSGLHNVNSTKFSWEHIRDHEDLCCLLISGNDIIFTPPIVPVQTLPYFDDTVRRVYLSATLKAPDSFVRTFGRTPEHFVAPETTAGECERLVLFPSEIPNIEDELTATKELIDKHKTLILVPSFFRGEQWTDVASLPGREAVPGAVVQFRQADPPDKMVLAARYDGIDLPGATCRMMVLDGLPTGTGPLEKFQYERLNMHNSFRSLLSSRIVQSFGRISRGLSDFGVVMITGDNLVDWLMKPHNRSLLPDFMQKQIAIGIGVSENSSEIERMRMATAACLNRNSDWAQFYSNNMRELETETVPLDLKAGLTIAKAEAEFGIAYWQRDFPSAAKAINNVLQKAFDFSPSTGAWLSVWLGYSLEMTGEYDLAHDFYRKAHATQLNLPAPRNSSQTYGTQMPDQILRVAAQMHMAGAASSLVQIPKTIVPDLRRLDGDGSNRQVEEALRCLGQYLGFDPSRPDNEFKAGPDVLWIDEKGSAYCMEVKSDKEGTSFYNKDDIGQMHNHIQWVKTNHNPSTIIPVFIGPIMPATNSSSPSPDMTVIELHEFEDLGERLVTVLRDAAAQTLPLEINNRLFELMRERELLYSHGFQTLNSSALVDIQRE